MARYIYVLALSFSALIIGTGNVYAKDLVHRLGVGYKNQFTGFSETSGGIAAQYYPNPDLGVSAALSVDTEEDASNFGFAAKVYRIIFKEQNMNFYMGGGVALLSLEKANSEGTVDNLSGFELNGMVGAEFFFSGLESLGFSFEAGVARVLCRQWNTLFNLWPFTDEGRNHVLFLSFSFFLG